ncbi:DNA-binding protein [Marilutibacter maris]|uniref:DNA-binding protein n=1 Tax=Marilutibacter maris TaxID=1605891 RepID=UPI001CB9BB84|nr:DNA-binding protein [Lysobacter maris]
MTHDPVLEQFQIAPIQLTSLGEINIAEALQPRAARLVPLRDRGRAQQSSEQHIATLRMILEVSEQSQLDAILLASVEHPPATFAPGLYVVDGHHRIKAYRLAGREAIPARVVSTDFRTAVLTSKLVNCSGRALAMHKEQCRDAAWQYLAVVTQQGAIDLPKGESLRSVGARFGISKNTVASMLTYLKQGVDVAGFHDTAVDVGTAWPRWRYVREAKNPRYTNLPTTDQERLDREAERVARQIVKIVDTSSPTARARALEMLANEEVSATSQVDSVTLLSHFTPLTSL